MIVKQIKGKGFFGCLKYVMEKAGATFIEGNIDAFKGIQEMAREFRYHCSDNPRVKRVVYHATLSIPPEDKGKLTKWEWGDVGRRFLEKMKFCADFNNPDCFQVPYIVVHHADTDHDHVHIVAGRVRSDGTCVSDSWDYRWGEKAVRELEVEFGLSQPFKQTNRKSAHPYLVEKLEKIYAKDSAGEDTQQEDTLTSEVTEPDPVAQEVQRLLEYRRKLRKAKEDKGKEKTQKNDDNPKIEKKEEPEKTKTLPSLIDQVCKQVKNIPEFLKVLKDKGVEATIRLTRNRCVQGIIYHHEGKQISGTKLGAAYTFPGLRKRQGLIFESKNHLPEIERHNRTCEGLSPPAKWQWLQDIANRLDRWLSQNGKQQLTISEFHAYREKDWLVISSSNSELFVKTRYDSKKREWLPQSGWRLNSEQTNQLLSKLSNLSTTQSQNYQPNRPIRRKR